MRKKLISLMCIVVLLLGNVFPSQAAIADGLSWPSRSATYSYSTTGVSANFINGCKPAANSWTNSTIFTFVYSNNSDKISIDEQRVDGVNWAGLTATRKPASFITSAFIIINSVYTSSYSSTKVRAVICHEMGHAIGLADESFSSTKRSIMLPSAEQVYDQNGIYTPQQVDINDIYSIYEDIQ